MRGVTPGLEALVSVTELSAEEHHEAEYASGEVRGGASKIPGQWVSKDGAGANCWHQVLAEL